MKEIAIIIPAYNEQKNIQKVIKDFSNLGKIFIVNDCSSDLTKFVCAKLKVKILNNVSNLGYDKSLRIGISYVVKNCPFVKFIVTIDGDGQHNAIEVRKMIKYIYSYNCIVGYRNKFNRTSEKIISMLSNYIFKIPDPLCGIKIFEKNSISKVLPKLNLNIDYCGMFFLKMYKKENIKIVKIKVKNKNKKSSYGDGLFANLKILISFFRTLVQKV